MPPISMPARNLLNALRNRVRLHPVASFFGFALALSWSYWLALLCLGVEVGPQSQATHFPGLLGPLLAALAVTGLESGTAGVRAQLRRTLRWPRPRLRVLCLALTPLLLGALAFGLLHLRGNAWPQVQDFARFPGLPGPMPLVWVVLLVLLVNGLGEEGGWRGFALERLVERHGRAGAAWRVAVLWGLWHAPLFWLNHSMHALLGPMIVGWAASLVCGAFVLAHVYLKSQGSILPVALWHGSYNLVTASAAGAGTASAIASAPVMIWGVAVAISWWWAQRRQQKSPFV